MVSPPDKLDNDEVQDSAWQPDDLDSSKKPTGPLVEPDFTFGPSADSFNSEPEPRRRAREMPAPRSEPTQPKATGSIPVWLAGAAPPPPTVQPGPVPAWLVHAKPPVSPAPGAVPGWIQAAPPPQVPAGTLPIARPEAPTVEPSIHEALDWLAGEPPQTQVVPSSEPSEIEPSEPPAGQVAEPSQPAEIEAGGLPDWLARELSARPEPPRPAEDEIPEWLRKYDLPAAEQEMPEPTTATPVEPPGAEAALDWLKDLEAPAPPSPEPVEAGVPDWLSGLGEPEPAATPVEPPGAEAALDWLKDLEAPAPPSPEPVEAGVPDWLSGLGEPEPAATPGTAPPSTDEVPDWLSDLGKVATAEALTTPPAPADEVEQPPMTAEAREAPAVPVPPLLDTGIPSWLQTPKGSQQAALPSEPGVVPEGAIPDWLAGLGEPAPEPAPSAAAEEKPLEQPADLPVSEIGAPDWLAGLDSAAPVAAPIAEGVDLLGLSSDLIAPTPVETRPAEAEEIAEGELPDWLRGVHRLGLEPEEAEQPAPAINPELLSQIQDLRYESITGQVTGEEKAAAETVGALKNVRGVIQPELIFEGSSLTVTEPAQELIVTETQARQIDLIKTLMARESEDMGVPARRRRVVPLLRWLVALVLIAAISVPFFMGLSPLPPSRTTTTPGFNRAFEALESLSADPATVLVAFEYEPGTAAEMELLAEALLWHLAHQPSTTVYAISTLPTGPAMAENVFRKESIRLALDTHETPWINLGYISGRANGISNLTVGSPQAVLSPWQFDHRGQLVEVTPVRLLGENFDLIVVLAGRADEARMWIEQAGQPTGIPVVAAMSVSSAPLIMPYQESGQVVAVLSGVNDAIAYQLRSGRQPAPLPNAIWNAQALGGAAAAVLIVLGGLIFGLTSFRSQQEQDR